jgi:hypothetical protein
MSEKKRIQLEMEGEDGDVACLRLPGHPGRVFGVVKKTVRLRTVLGEYNGPDLYWISMK